jgi:hypothetical protein
MEKYDFYMRGKSSAKGSSTKENYVICEYSTVHRRKEKRQTMTNKATQRNPTSHLV